MYNKFLDYAAIINNYGCKEIVIQTKDPYGTFKQFEDIIKNASNTDEKFNQRKYVVFQDEAINPTNSLPPLRELKYVSDLLIIEKQYVNNNGINTSKDVSSNIFIEESDMFILSTHRFIGNENYQDKMFIDKWFAANESFLYDNNLFPDKISDLQGKTLRLISLDYEPYSVSDGENDIYDGVEAILLEEYARKLNATLSYQSTDDWGDIYENWTGPGVMGNLAEDNADIGFGAMYRWIVAWPYLDFSVTHIRGGMRLYVPGPRLAGGWLQPTHSYSSTVWQFSIFTFFFCSIFLCLILIFHNYQEFKSFDKISKSKEYIDMYIRSLFRTTRIFLEQPLTGVSEERIFKTLIFFIIVQTLLLSSFYKSGYASIMTIPRYEGVINTVQDFVDSGMKWGAPSELWVAALVNTDEELEKKYKIVAERFIVASMEELIEFGKDKTFSYPVERLQHGHYALLEFHSGQDPKNYRMTDEDLYWDYCVYMTKKNSIYLPTLDKFIFQIFESGVVSHWESEIVAKYMDSSVQNLMNDYYHHYEEKRGAIKLAWKHTQGAFGVLIIGYIVSTICFIMEHVIHHHRKISQKFVRKTIM